MTARLSTWLALRCREPEFQKFLIVGSEAEAALCVRNILDIDSRREIDLFPDVAAKFHEYIRKPFAEFMQSQNQKEMHHDH